MVAAFGICQPLEDQFKQVKGISAQGEAAREMADLPRALCFAVDALKDSIQLKSHFALLAVQMLQILWLKNWSAGLPCQKLSTGFPFHGERLFGDDLNRYIKKKW